MDELIRKALKIADEAELAVEDSRTNSFTAFAKNKTSLFEEKQVYSIRVIKDGRVGFSRFNELKDFDKALQFAADDAKFSEKLGISFPCCSEFPRIRGTYDKKIEQLGEKELAGILSEGISRIEQSGLSNTKSTITSNISRTLHLNSNGFEGKMDATSFSANFGAQSGDSTSSYWGMKPHFFDPGHLADKTIERTKFSANAKPISGGYPLLFEDEFMAKMMGRFLISDICGNNVFDKRTPLLGKMGQRIAPEGINITEDPLRDGCIASYPFDDEGTLCKKKAIVEDGILNTFVYDLKYAKKCGAEPKGNGFNDGIGSRPYPKAACNIVVESKDRVNLSEFTGVSVRKVLTIRPNRMTGEFSTQIIEGSLIEKGEPIKPIRGCLLVGNFYEMLDTLRLADNNMEYGRFFSPSWIVDGKMV